MSFSTLLVAVLFLYLPVFESANEITVPNEHTNQVEKISQSTFKNGHPQTEWTKLISLRNQNNAHKEIKNPNNKKERLTDKKERRKKNLARKETLAKQHELLLALRDQLKEKGIDTQFLDKVFQSDQKMRIRIGERLIKRAKKKIAKAVKRGIKIRNEKPRRRKTIKAANLFSSKNIPGIKSLTGAYSRGQVRGSLNPCPTGQTRVRGRCKCPFLSEWSSIEEKCNCIYGTYRDNRGNCRNHF